MLREMASLFFVRLAVVVCLCYIFPMELMVLMSYRKTSLTFKKQNTTWEALLKGDKDFFLFFF